MGVHEVTSGGGGQAMPGVHGVPGVPGITVGGVAGVPGMVISGIPGPPGIVVDGVPGVPGITVSGVPGVPGLPGIYRHAVAVTNCCGDGACSSGMSCATSLASTASGVSIVISTCAPLSSRRSFATLTRILMAISDSPCVSAGAGAEAAAYAPPGRTSVYPLAKMIFVNSASISALPDLRVGRVTPSTVPCTYAPAGIATRLPITVGNDTCA